MTAKNPLSNLHRRLRKLEAKMTDQSGLAPHSAAWFAHWNERYNRFLTTRDADAIQGMPLAYVDAILAEGRNGEQTR